MIDPYARLQRSNAAANRALTIIRQLEARRLCDAAVSLAIDRNVDGHLRSRKSERPALAA